MKNIRQYWYYYKTLVIVGALALALIVYSLIQSGNTEQFARYAAVISSAAYSEEAVEGLKNALTRQFGSFGVNVYQVTLGALNQNQAALAKLDLDLGRKISDTLLVEDPQALQDATGGLDVSEPVRVADISYLAGLGFDELWLVTRK